MHTLPHENNQNGYSLRIGKNLPDNAANLAYVHTDTPAPNKNLSVINLANNIPENREKEPDYYKELYTNHDTNHYLLQDGKPFLVNNENILLTNEYTYDNYQTPLYYVHSLNKEVNIGNQEVYHYLNGKRRGQRTTYNRIQPEQYFVYENPQIKLTKNNYEELSYNEKYKIIGIPTPEPNIARLYILTNFTNSASNTYQVEYNAYENNRVANTRETLNPVELFSPQETEYHTNLIHSYKLVPAPNHQGYYIQILTDNDLEEKEINPLNREPYTFNYQINMHIENRFSSRNPGTINIGYIYINESVYNSAPLSSGVRKLVGGGIFPDYITFRNPHHGAGSPYPESSDYWIANLEMPEEHYLDYDILILAGYGNKNMTAYNQYLKAFLESGGLLFIENTSGTSLFNFYDNDNNQTFFMDIEFEENYESTNQYELLDSEFNKRYHNNPRLTPALTQNARINLHNDTSNQSWKTIYRTETGNPVLTYTEYNGGKIFVSSIGFLIHILYNTGNAHQVLANLLLYHLEHRTFKTPVFKNHVMHHDDLFPEDYLDAQGNTVYYNDVNDTNQTQIIAKKLLGGKTAEVANRYLPIPYQNPINAYYDIQLKDTHLVPLENTNFEKFSEETKFQNTKVDALPGWRYVVQSQGEKSDAGITSDIFYSGTQSAYLDFENTKGFFEKEIINLPKGYYELSAYIKTENTNGGEITVFTIDSQDIAYSEPVTGTNNWKRITASFQLETNTTVYVRLGASSYLTTGKMYFDDVELTNEGNIRMTPDNNGDLDLYAYAIEPKGQNYLLDYQNNSNINIIKSDAVIEPVIRIRSFVYEWNSTNQNYQKQYGKNSYVKASLSSKDGEKVIARMIDVIPTNEAGYQWNYPQNIYYQVEIDPTDKYYHFVNLSLYDPSINQYFYANNGQWIVNREDLWGSNIEPTLQLRATSLVDNMKITGGQYTLVQLNNSQIKLLPPSTIHENDRWYARIKNGSFSRNLFNEEDITTLAQMNMQNYPKEYVVGKHQYSLPEYHRQTFYPRKGERLIQGEIANYINPNTIQIQNYPMVIKERLLYTPLYNFENDKKTFRALDTFWDNRFHVEVYHDEQRIYDGYDINFNEGAIIFDNEVPDTTTVYARYQQNNVKIYRRRLSNYQIEKEQLERVDDNTLKFSKKNIATSPKVNLYRDGLLINPNEYWIDFNEGLLHFYQDNRKNIYATYSYYIYEELFHKDINALKGEITLFDTIHFRDEIVVDYLYKENHLEYKGYYDEDSQVYMHLDLNPTAGHTFTAKAYDESGNLSHYYEESSEKLLNQTIYFYLIPQYSQFIDNYVSEENTVRHCFNEKEWLYYKTIYPSAILLGTIFVRENTNIHNITLLDARKLGGGLKSSVSNERINKTLSYTSGLWDIGGFDGLSYYRNGVTIIQIPEHVLKQHGGLFTEEDVEKIINKYLALGVYPIIEYYNPREESEINIIGEALLLRTVLDASNTMIVEEE